MPSYTIGWVHNLHDPHVHSLGEILIVVALCFTVSAFLFFALRVGIRIKARQLGFDDLAAFSSLALGIAFTVLAILQTQWGLGLSPINVPEENVETCAKIQYASEPVYCLALLGFKLSILLFYIQLAGDNTVYRRILYFAIGLVTANQIIFTCLLSFSCRPIAKQWDQSLPGTCIDQVASYFALGATTLALDLFIFVLPFPALLRLHLNKSKKLALTGIFALGFFFTMIQVVRIFIIANLADYTSMQKLIGWSIVEINLGVVISCFVTFGKLFQYLFSETGRQPPSSQQYGSSPPEKSSKNGPRGKLGRSNSTTSVVSTTDNLWQGNSSNARSYFAVHSSQSSSPPSEEIGFERRQSQTGIWKTIKISVELENADGTKLDASQLQNTAHNL